MGHSHDVFISYAHVDIEFARVVARLLEKVHLEVWLDEEEEQGGETVHSKIEKALDHSRHAVVVASDAWRARPWTEWEAKRFRMIMSTERRLVPILRVNRDLNEFGPYLDGLDAVQWLPDAKDIDARFWLLFCNLGYSPRAGAPETWAAAGRKELGWPPPPAPIPEIAAPVDGPSPRPLLQRPSLCLEGPAPVLLLNRDTQWGQLDRLVRSPNTALALVIGDRRQAHDYFLRRVQYCLPSDPPRDIRPVRWPPIPPNSEADYKEALAAALDCSPEQLVPALKTAVRDRNLVLVHAPVVQAALHNDAFIRYYTEWLPGIISDVDPDPRPDDQVGAIKAIQAVTWVDAPALKTVAARLIRRAGWHRRWTEDATEHDEARRLLSRLRTEASPRLPVVVLDELTDISRADVTRWEEFLPASADRERLVEGALRGCVDSAAIFEAIAENFGGGKELRP